MKFAFAKRSSLGDLNVQSAEFNRTLYEVGPLKVNFLHLYIYFSSETDEVLLKVYISKNLMEEETSFCMESSSVVPSTRNA